MAPGDGHDRPARYLKSFPRRIVGAVVQIGLPDRLLEFRIPQNDVGIKAHRNRALARVKAIDTGVIGGSQFDELLETDPSFRYPFREEDRQARLTPGIPFGTQRNDVREFGVSLPFGSSYRNGQ